MMTRIWKVPTQCWRCVQKTRDSKVIFSSKVKLYIIHLCFMKVMESWVIDIFTSPPLSLMLSKWDDGDVWCVMCGVTTIRHFPIEMWCEVVHNIITDLWPLITMATTTFHTFFMHNSSAKLGSCTSMLKISKNHHHHQMLSFQKWT